MTCFLLTFTMSGGPNPVAQDISQSKFWLPYFPSVPYAVHQWILLILLPKYVQIWQLKPFALISPNLSFFVFSFWTITTIFIWVSLVHLCPPMVHFPNSCVNAIISLSSPKTLQGLHRSMSSMSKFSPRFLSLYMILWPYLLSLFLLLTTFLQPWLLLFLVLKSTPCLFPLGAFALLISSVTVLFSSQTTQINVTSQRVLFWSS